MTLLPTFHKSKTQVTPVRLARSNKQRSTPERLFLPLVFGNVFLATFVVFSIVEGNVDGPHAVLEASIESSASVSSSSTRSLLDLSGVQQPSEPLDASTSAAATKIRNQEDLSRVGFDGGAWTAQTHLSQYGFNVDWGLMEVLEDACREIEDSHNAADSKWYQYHQDGFLNNFWKPPKIVDAKVLEIGCGVGVYVDALKKEQAKKNRKVFGIEPNPMGGTFNRKRGRGPKQLAVNILEQGDTFEFAKKIRQEELGGDYFDLIYSIEVFEHMPMDRHVDAARFMAGLAKEGTKLIFGASSPGQAGTGHIGNRKKAEWEKILKDVGFHKDAEATQKAVSQMQEYNHKKNTQVYWFRGDSQQVVSSSF